MDILTWLVVGLVAGTLASIVVKEGGSGLVRDIVIGIIGAVLGGWAFQELGWRSPFTGLAGVIAVAFVGSVVLLLALRLLVRRRV